MTQTEIKIALLKSGVSISEIAEALGTQRSSVSSTVKGVRTTPSIRHAIAKAINQPVHHVFPDEIYRRPSGRIVQRVGFTA